MTGSASLPRSHTDFPRRGPVGVGRLRGRARAAPAQPAPSRSCAGSGPPDRLRGRQRRDPSFDRRRLRPSPAPRERHEVSAPATPVKGEVSRCTAGLARRTPAPKAGRRCGGSRCSGRIRRGGGKLRARHPRQPWRSTRRAAVTGRRRLPTRLDAEAAGRLGGPGPDRPRATSPVAAGPAPASSRTVRSVPFAPCRDSGSNVMSSTRPSTSGP